MKIQQVHQSTRNIGFNNPTYQYINNKKGRLKSQKTFSDDLKATTLKLRMQPMNEQELNLDNLDNLLDDFDGVTVEGGVDSENDDGCEGGACKI